MLHAPPCETATAHETARALIDRRCRSGNGYGFVQMQRRVLARVESDQHFRMLAAGRCSPRVWWVRAGSLTC